MRNKMLICIMEIDLNIQNRVKEVTFSEIVKKLKIEVSRDNCKDVLLEVIDAEGKAKGKPLQKWLPEIKQKGIARLRFMMNDFSTKPIKIKIDF